jgi:pimeloyl-ACP methyl ester carboxylesterase
MIRHRLRWSLVAFAAILAASILTTAGAFARDDRNPRPTVVLVHGAFADASSWSPVIARLQDDGFPVVAPANPLRGIASDASYLSSFLNTIDGPIVLVGHSYGGAVITNAAAGHSNVKALVYVAAFIPDVGQTLADLSSPAGGSDLQPTLILRPCPPQFCALGAEGYIDPAKFRAVFAADLPRDKAATMAVAQRPASLSTLVEPTTAAAWKSLPSWAVVATRDHAIGTANVRAMAQHAGASITEVAASHVVMLSQPEVVVRVIRSAAASLKP